MVPHGHPDQHIQCGWVETGDHSLIVKDAAGCTAEVKVNITENILPLTVSIKLQKYFGT
jgi:hypothetical protein